MEKIYIKTTEACNIRCRHCYIGDFRNELRFFDEIKTINWLKSHFKTNQIDESSILFSFHGGEPFLCPLHKMQAVVEAFPKAQFDATSNLLFELTDKHIEFIKKSFFNRDSGKPFIKTSWDYEIRFPNKDAERLWQENVRKLLENGIDVKVITCLTKPLLNKISGSQYVAYMRNLGVIYTDFERLTENTTADNSLLVSYKNIDDWLLDVYENNDCLEIGMFSSMAAATCGTYIACRKRQCMSNVLTINADGSIGGCPNTAKLSPFYHINGEATESKRQELIHIEEIRNPICYTCDLYGYCNGSCHQLSWQNNVCPEPKKLWRRIIHDVESKQGIGLPNHGI